MPPAPSELLVPDERGTFTFTIGRFQEPVTGSVQLLTRDEVNTPSGRRRASIATVPFHSRPDGGTHLRVRLSAEMALVLRRYQRLDVDVQVVARDALGNAGVSLGCIVLATEEPASNQSRGCA